MGEVIVVVLLLAAACSRLAPRGAHRRGGATRAAAMILVAFAVVPPVHAEDAEEAAASALTGIDLPQGAHRLLAKEQAEQAAMMFKSLYKDFRFGAIETLYWEGDYRGEDGAALRRSVTRALEKVGHTCSETAFEHQIEDREGYLLAAVREKRRVLGLWISSNEAAMLTWGEEQSDAAAPAKAGVFQNVIYTTPPGWSATVAPDAVTLVPDDLLPEEKLLVLVFAGRAFDGDLDASLHALFAETCQELGVEAGQPPSSAFVSARTCVKGWKYAQVRTTVRKDDTRLFLHAWFIQVGGRLERVVAVTNLVCWPSDDTPLDSPRYDDAFLRFVHGLRFANHRDPVLPAGSLAGGGITGVWVGFGLGFSGMRGEVEYSSFTAAFYSNGHVFFSTRLQTSLFEGMDPYLAREIAPAWWGTYTFEDGRGVMRMPQGDIPVRLDGEKLVITRMQTDHKYVRLASVDGMRWEGTWEFEPREGGTPSITFTKDGRFRDNGAVKVLEHSLYGLYSTGDKPGAGTYEVRNFTLLLTYSDGRRFTAAYLGLWEPRGDPRPAELRLGFNQDMLKRR
jgi:hypothetical protein